MEGTDPRVISYTFLAIVVVGGIYAIRMMIHRFGQQADEKTRKVAAQPASPGDSIADARAAMDRGDWQAAASYFQEAGRPMDAARALRSGKQWVRAAELFEAQRDFTAAAQCYKRAEDGPNQLRMLSAGQEWLAAAEVAEAAGDLAQAAEFRLQGNDVERAIRLLRKVGHLARAAKLAGPLAEAQGNWSEAAENWQVAQDWPRALAAWNQAGNHHAAAIVLVQLGRHDEAADRFVKATSYAEAGALYEQLGLYRNAALNYQRAGNVERAIHCLTLEGDKVAVVKLSQALGQTEEALRVALSAQPTDPAFMDLMRLAVAMLRERNDRGGLGRALLNLMQAPLATEERIALGREALTLLVEVGDLARARHACDRLLPLAQPGSELEQWLSSMEAKLPGAATRTLHGGAALSTGPRTNTAPAVKAGPRLRQPSSGMMMAVSVDEETLNFPGEGDGVSWPAGVPAALAARYEELRRLGQGGNGVVFRAKDKLLGRPVVLKFMLEGTMPSDMARKYFLREVKLSAALNHPNIVHIYDMGESDDVPWYCMEYVDGQPLTAHLHHGEPVADRAWLVSVVDQLCAALDHAHGQGMVHRDIKPDNILVTHDGKVKLLDFGLARVLHDGFGEQSVLAGTPYYMAPEQLNGGAVDHRADIYALGCVLYRMFTGFLPYTEGNVFVAHAIEPVPDARRINPDLPDGAADIVFRAMAKRPEERFSDCRSIAQALRQSMGA